MGLRMKNVNIMGSSLKHPIFSGVPKKPIYKGELPKRGGGGLGQFQDLRWGVAWQKRGEVVDTLMYTMKHDCEI